MDFCTKWRSAASTPMTALSKRATPHVLLSMTWLARGGLIVGCSSGGSGGASWLDPAA
jgi:hypothetical protein